MSPRVAIVLGTVNIAFGLALLALGIWEGWAR